MAHTVQVTLTGGLKASLTFPSWHSKDGQGLRAAIACHGHGGDQNFLEQGGPFAGHPEFWAERGYVVGLVAVGNTWLNATAMSDLTTLYQYLMGLGVVGTKVALLGWSMGGGNALRWILENPTLVSAAYLCSPASDLDWFEASGSFKAEVDAAYSSSYSTTGTQRSPKNNAAAFRGGPPILIGHATNDATIPYSMTTGLVAAVNDPAVQLRQPDILGDHQGGLTQVSPRETWEFVRAHAA